MRNLKKALAMVLALMMALSLMSFASAVDYPDSGSVTKNEAVDVMSAINVFQGTDGGNFDPNGELTRAQAAKIISYMKLGADGAETLPKDESPFGDVKAERWYTGYVAYAKAEGIINGRSEEVFDPNGKVTGYEFGKMVLEAAGIKGEYSGTSSWAINISINLRKENADGTTLLDGIKDIVLSKNITREQACQMAFNGLIYTPAGAATGKWEVVYHASYTGTKVPDGLTFNTFDAAVAAVKAVYPGATYGTADANGFTVRAETDLSGSLAATVFQLSKASGTDAFGAPARVWSVAGKGEVARVASGSSKSYTGSVTGATIAKDINVANTVVPTVIVDGKDSSNASALSALTGGSALGGNGAKVDVYKTDATTVKVVVVNTYIGTITDKSYKAADESKNVKEQVAITLDTVKPTGATAASIVFETSKFTKDDEGKTVLYTAAYDRDADDNTYAIVGADFPGEVTGTPTRSNATTFVMGGTTYNYGAKAVVTKSDVDTLVTNKTEVTFYTDKDGNVMGTKEDTKTSDTVYALIQDVTIVSTNGWNKEVRAKLLGLDGKTTEVVVTELWAPKDDNSALEKKDIINENDVHRNLKDLKGDFVKVEQDGDATKVKLYSHADGTDASVYNTDGTGSTATSGDSAQITRNTPSLVANGEGFTSAIANAKTVFLYEDSEGNVTVYNGIGSVATAKYVGTAGRAVIKSGVAVAVYVKAPVLVDDGNATSDVVYVAVKSYDTATSADKGQTTVYNAVVNGEITTIEVKGAALKVGETPVNHAADDQLLSSVTKDSDGLIIRSSALETGKIALHNGYVSVKDGVIDIDGSNIYSYSDDTKVYFIDDEGKITEGAISDLKAAGDVNDKIVGYTVNNVVAALFVTTVADPTAGDATLTVAGEAEVNEEANITLTATFTANTSSRTVESYAWTSSDATKATVTAGDPATTATVAGVAAGKVTITVTATLDNGAKLTATKDVTVKTVVPHTHTKGDKVEAVPATCTTDGSSAYWKCGDGVSCTTKLDESGAALANQDVTISKTGHAYTFTEGTGNDDGKHLAGTCTNSGCSQAGADHNKPTTKGECVEGCTVCDSMKDSLPES